jgi:hypothetical protein
VAPELEAVASRESAGLRPGAMNGVSIADLGRWVREVNERYAERWLN